jgi:hypothetical protein
LIRQVADLAGQSDRANAARRALHANSVRPEQVVEIRGFADRRLLFPEAPTSPRNRRISLVVKSPESDHGEGRLSGSLGYYFTSALRV